MVGALQPNSTESQIREFMGLDSGSLINLFHGRGKSQLSATSALYSTKKMGIGTIYSMYAATNMSWKFSMLGGLNTFIHCFITPGDFQPIGLTSFA